MARGRKRTLDDTHSEMAEGASAADLNALREADRKDAQVITKMDSRKAEPRNDEEDDSGVILDRWQERKAKKRLRSRRPQVESLVKKGVLPPSHLEQLDERSR